MSVLYEPFQLPCLWCVLVVYVTHSWSCPAELAVIKWLPVFPHTVTNESGDGGIGGLGCV